MAPTSMTIHWKSVALGAAVMLALEDVLQLLLGRVMKTNRPAQRFQQSLAYRLTVAPISTLFALVFSKKDKNQAVSQGAYWDLVGNTPLVRIKSLSDELGIEVLGKAEFLNPGGSVKDRVAKEIIIDAENRGKLTSAGDRLFEGTSGSTGISLALAANCRGYKASIFMPDDQAKEKPLSLSVCGAEVTELRPCSITDPEHYVNAARVAADAVAGQSQGKHKGFFADQFENLANFRAHYEGTGVELLDQTGCNIDVFVDSAGTGGTIAGVGARLKKHIPSVKVILADPPGSALYNKIRYGVLYNGKDAEGYRSRRIFDTIIEGVGINRLTRNFLEGEKYIDYCYTASDLEVVHMSRYLIAKDGLFLGSSSALNCCAIVKAVKAGVISPGSTVVVILCDSGVRHLSRFYNPTFLASHSLLPKYISADAEPVTTTDSSVSPSALAANSLRAPESVFEFID